MSAHQPPKLARRIFEWYCGHASIHDLLGDLEEWFDKNQKTKSLFRARLIYWKQVLSLMVSYAIRKRKKDVSFSPYQTSNSIPMLKNYFKVAIRNLYQYRYFSILNTFGLAIGMSIGLLMISIFVYVKTYDNFHVNSQSIYSITTTRTEGIEQRDYASAPVILAEKLQEGFPAAKKIVRVLASFEGEVTADKQNLDVSGYYVDPGFLTLFTFDMLEGNAATVLTDPYSVVLTASAAKRFFNSVDVVGKILTLQGVGAFTVTGVMKDHPANTHFQFEALASYASLPPSDASVARQWTTYGNQYIYVQLPEKSDREKLTRYLEGVSKQVNRLSDVKLDFQVEALRDISTTDRSNAIGPKWEMSGFIAFGIIALIILLPACFNYTNLSIARALKRSKEIGIRKTMGGSKNQIIFQFITETVLITLISLVGALAIFVLIRSEFQSMLVHASALDLSLSWQMLIAFIGFALFTGGVAGVLPALHFSNINPIQALKSQAGKVLTGMRIRKGLTIFQFALSFCFILSLIVFGRQYRSLLNFDFGFEKENIVDVELRGANPEILKTEFSKLAAVRSVSLSSGTLGLSAPAIWIQIPGTTDSLEVRQMFVDEDYIQNFKLEFLAGQNFPSSLHHERFIIVNEEFLKWAKIESAADAIGKSFQVEGKELQICGVLRNFNYAMPQLPIRSFFFRSNPARFTIANMNVDVTDAYGTLAAMETSWKKFAPGERFEARFFKDKLNDSYLAYITMLKIAGFLGLLAITISILGLLGMVVYTSETRVKEVSIRKVMGASGMGLITMLSKDYLKLIVWAIVIAIPFAILVFKMVFSRIPDYNVNLTVWDILLSTLALLALGLTTIASQTLKTAAANPAETLRSE